MSPVQHPAIQPFDGPSVCLFCGSSEAAHADYIQVARDFGAAMATRSWRLVYGGGGVGLMGASARAAHEAGGKVLGIMPNFLRSRERLFDDVETLVVDTMHERKILMYDQSDAFVVAPGGVGTLEEVVELLSWKRLDLHAKPVIFLNTHGFWATFFALMEHSVAEGMTPPSFLQAWDVCDTVEEAADLLARRFSEAASTRALKYDQR
ncbi:MAG: TIGR00730 family Rossman fold protein [Brevundimonas sp.]|uniref:LOG family protein n=1 Tax=Brevundimonas sp. TaxID=1871086 RepID=UPI0025C443D0|nr:TIGR00730 family Rossman fold protein [Brevundimonas sp.]MBX3476543.1 TIGR00730 family Rossman fold protein [Brevundimonas sp.]